MPHILETWRRHLQAARRRMVRCGQRFEGDGRVCRRVADLVGFTALSQQLDDHELAHIVSGSRPPHDTVGARGAPSR
jgi:class 3 adenylate cyclase